MGRVAADNIFHAKYVWHGIKIEGYPMPLAQLGDREGTLVFFPCNGTRHHIVIGADIRGAVTLARANGKRTAIVKETQRRRQ